MTYVSLKFSNVMGRFIARTERMRKTVPTAENFNAMTEKVMFHIHKNVMEKRTVRMGVMK